jgi:hypothetical protein
LITFRLANVITMTPIIFPRFTFSKNALYFEICIIILSVFIQANGYAQQNNFKAKMYDQYSEMSAAIIRYGQDIISAH